MNFGEPKSPRGLQPQEQHSVFEIRILLVIAGDKLFRKKKSHIYQEIENHTKTRGWRQRGEENKSPGADWEMSLAGPPLSGPAKRGRYLTCPLV